MPWSRTSRQAIRPFPLSSHERRASVVPEDCALRKAEGSAVDGPVSQLRTTISVDAQAESTRSKASASRASTVKAYLRRTSTTRTANQQRFIDGIHCAASWCFLRLRSTSGPASVRLSRSEAKRRRVPAPAAPSRKAARNGEPAFGTVGLRDPVADRLGGGFGVRTVYLRQTTTLLFTSQFLRSPSSANQLDHPTPEGRRSLSPG